MKLKPISYPKFKSLERKQTNVPFVETPNCRMEINWLNTRVDGRDKVIAVFVGRSWPEVYRFLLNERGYEEAKKLLEEKTLSYIQGMVKQWTDWVEF